MVSAVSDTSSVVSIESSQDSSDFAIEREAVLYQRRLAKGGPLLGDSTHIDVESGGRGVWAP